MHKNKKTDKGGPSKRKMDTESQEIETDIQKVDMRKIMKQIQLLGSSHMTWKERKEVENRKVIALGGKPQKKQRLPLSVAKGVMKNQKKREEKLLEQNLISRHFGGGSGGGSKRSVEKKRPEKRVLKASEGHFRNGVLDVKHLLRTTQSRGGDAGAFRTKSKGNRMKNKGQRSAVDLS